MADYFRFVLSLQEPLLLNYEDLMSKLNISASQFEGRAFSPDDQYKKIFLKDDRGNIELTLKQFFLFFKVYNVPIYLVGKP